MDYGEWRMECSAVSVENRGIVKRSYGEWGPTLFTLPRSYLTYNCTTEGVYSAIPLGVSAMTECAFDVDDAGLWVELAGDVSKRDGLSTDAMMQRRRATMGLPWYGCHDLPNQNSESNSDRSPLGSLKPAVTPRKGVPTNLCACHLELEREKT